MEKNERNESFKTFQIFLIASNHIEILKCGRLKHLDYELEVELLEEAIEALILKYNMYTHNFDSQNVYIAKLALRIIRQQVFDILLYQPKNTAIQKIFKKIISLEI